MITRPESELHFQKSASPKPTVEVHLDSVDAQGVSFDGVITQALADYALHHPQTTATIYTHNGMSVNFHEAAWTVFLIVVGQEALLQTLGKAFASIAGVKSRFSDAITPSLQRHQTGYHIEDGKLWVPYEEGTWVSSEPSDQNLASEQGQSTTPAQPAHTGFDASVNAWGSDLDDLPVDTADEAQDTDEASSPKRVAQATRFRAARSDARVGGTRQEIERVFGLPAGSVTLLGPDGRPLRSDAFIGTLRSRWENA